MNTGNLQYTLSTRYVIIFNFWFLVFNVLQASVSGAMLTFLPTFQHTQYTSLLKVIIDVRKSHSIITGKRLILGFFSSLKSP